MLVKLGIDFENTARHWWESGGRELWTSIAEAPDASKTIVEESIAKSWMAQAAEIPGWFDGPEHAPHPVHLSPLAEDEFE